MKTHISLAVVGVSLTLALVGYLLFYLTPKQTKVATCHGRQGRIGQLIDQITKQVTNSTGSKTADSSILDELASSPDPCNLINALMILKSVKISHPVTYGDYETLIDEIHVKSRKVDVLLDKVAHSANQNGWRRVLTRWRQLTITLTEKIAKFKTEFEEKFKKCTEMILSDIEYENAATFYDDLRGNSTSMAPITFITIAFWNETSKDDMSNVLSNYHINFYKFHKTIDYVSAARSIQTIAYQMKKLGQLNETYGSYGENVLLVDDGLSSLIGRNKSERELTRASLYISDTILRIGSAVDVATDGMAEKIVSFNSSKDRLIFSFRTRGEIILSKACNSSSEAQIYNIIDIYLELLSHKYDKTVYDQITETVAIIEKWIVSNKNCLQSLSVLGLIEGRKEVLIKKQQRQEGGFLIEMVPEAHKKAGLMIQSGDFKSFDLLNWKYPNAYKNNMKEIVSEAFTKDHDKMWNVVQFPLILREADQILTFNEMIDDIRYATSPFILALSKLISSSNISDANLPFDLPSPTLLRLDAADAASNWACNFFESFSYYDYFLQEVKLFATDNRTKDFFDAKTIMNTYLDREWMKKNGEDDDWNLYIFWTTEELNMPDLTLQFLSTLYWRINETNRFQLDLTLRTAAALHKITHQIDKSFRNDHEKVMNHLPISIRGIVKGERLCITSADDKQWINTTFEKLVHSDIHVVISNVTGSSLTRLDEEACSPYFTIYTLNVKNECFRRNDICCMSFTANECWVLRDVDFHRNLYNLCNYPLKECAVIHDGDGTCGLTKNNQGKTVWQIEPC